MKGGGAAATALVVLGAACTSSHAASSSSTRASATAPSTTLTSTPATPPSTTLTAPTTAAPTTATPTTTAPTTATTTTTTVDQGALRQTRQLPSAADPAFLARINDLWQAVLTGNTTLARSAFFPVSAYIQVKGVSDPVHDYDTRLIPEYNQDISALHAEVPKGATFASVSVPDAAEWILPGVEYNKGSYWRVYSTRVVYDVGGLARSFSIASMISWRGEWYVVHLSAIR